MTEYVNKNFLFIVFLAKETYPFLGSNGPMSIKRKTLVQKLAQCITSSWKCVWLCTTRFSIILNTHLQGIKISQHCIHGFSQIQNLSTHAYGIFFLLMSELDQTSFWRTKLGLAWIYKHAFGAVYLYISLYPLYSILRPSTTRPPPARGRSATTPTASPTAPPASTCPTGTGRRGPTRAETCTG